MRQWISWWPTGSNLNSFELSKLLMTFTNQFPRMLHLIWLSMNPKLCYRKPVLQGYFLRVMVVEITESLQTPTWWPHRERHVDTQRRISVERTWTLSTHLHVNVLCPGSAGKEIELEGGRIGMRWTVLDDWQWESEVQTTGDLYTSLRWRGVANRKGCHIYHNGYNFTYQLTLSCSRDISAMEDFANICPCDEWSCILCGQ